jgi:SAM-dependent methyltransferase
MSPENKKLINKIFTKSRKFDIINCQFAIHYLFDSNNSTSNLITNIKNYLKDDGYLICTLFDPNQNGFGAPTIGPGDPGRVLI